MREVHTCTVLYVRLVNLRNCSAAGLMAFAIASEASNSKMDGRSEDEIPADEFKYAEAAISHFPLN